MPLALSLLTALGLQRDSRQAMPDAHFTGSPYWAASGSHLGQVRVSACAGDATVKTLKTIPIAMMRALIGLSVVRQRLRALRSPTKREGIRP